MDESWACPGKRNLETSFFSEIGLLIDTCEAGHTNNIFRRVWLGNRLKELESRRRESQWSFDPFSGDGMDSQKVNTFKRSKISLI